VLRHSKQNGESALFREVLSGKLRDWSRREAENARPYQKKQLRVVKGKTNPYRQKLQQA
jgi:hypothetical protein